MEEKITKNQHNWRLCVKNNPFLILVNCHLLWPTPWQKSTDR
jgi:hypothetical protein